MYILSPSSPSSPSPSRMRVEPILSVFPVASPRPAPADVKCWLSACPNLACARSGKEKEMEKGRREKVERMMDNSRRDNNTYNNISKNKCSGSSYIARHQY